LTATVLPEIFRSDPEALDEIYARKEIGKTKLNIHDVRAFEMAGKGLIVRNTIKRFLTLGFSGSKNLLAGGFDTSYTKHETRR